jgi:serine/threonine-protein kinase HipA
LRVSPYSHATIHPYLWGLLPDNDRVLERWAREFGCSFAATTSIRTFGAERALVVERYDRIVEDSEAVVRVHQEDLCQALRVHPDRKYEVDGGPGAEQIGRLIREVAGDRDAARFIDALASRLTEVARR